MTTATANWSSALAVGTYKVEAKAIDDLGFESASTSQITFYVTTSVQVDLTLKWDVYMNVPVDATLLWEVIAIGQIDISLLWNVYDPAEVKDITLLWNVNDVWEDVSDNTDTPTWNLVSP